MELLQPESKTEEKDKTQKPFRKKTPRAIGKELGIVVKKINKKENRVFVPPGDGEYGFCIFNDGIVGLWILAKIVIFYTSRCGLTFERDAKVSRRDSIPALASQFNAAVWKFLDSV